MKSTQILIYSLLFGSIGFPVAVYLSPVLGLIIMFVGTIGTGFGVYKGWKMSLSIDPKELNEKSKQPRD